MHGLILVYISVHDIFHIHLYVTIVCIFLVIGCPQIVRMDRGTENSEVARFQIVFRMSHADNLAAEKSIRYGSSPSNSVCAEPKAFYVWTFHLMIHYTCPCQFWYQRMESWWSKFRIMKMHWWIETLKVCKCLCHLHIPRMNSYNQHFRNWNGMDGLMATMKCTGV